MSGERCLVCHSPLRFHGGVPTIFHDAACPEGKDKSSPGCGSCGEQKRIIVERRVIVTETTSSGDKRHLEEKRRCLKCRAYTTVTQEVGNG